MTLETFTNEQLEELAAIARAATPGEWNWGCTPTKTVNAAVRWSAKSIRASGAPGLWEVYAGVPDNPRITAMTGNGPTSEANAAFIVSAQPRHVLALIEDLQHARRELAAAIAHHERCMDIIERALGEDRHEHEGAWLAESIALDIQALRGGK